MYLVWGIAHQLLMALKIILDFLQVIWFGFIFLPLSVRCELKTWAMGLQHWVFLYWWTTGGEACFNKCWQHCVIFAGLSSFSTVHGALGILRNTLSYKGRNLWALDMVCGFQWYSQLWELLSRCWIAHCQQVYVLFRCFGSISNWTADFQSILLLILWNSLSMLD